MMTTNTKLEILQFLMERNMFASSPAALAGELGYKGKNVFYRILDGSVGERSIDKVWELLKEYSGMNDIELYLLAKVVAMAREVADKLNAYDEEEILNVLVFASPKGKKLVGDGMWDELLSIRRNCMMAYCWFIILLHIDRHDINPYNGQEPNIQMRLMEELNDLLHQLFPENGDAPETMENYRSELSQYDNDDESLWTLLVRPAYLVRSYIDPTCKTDLLDTMAMLPVGEVSYWAEKEKMHDARCRFFILQEYIPENNNSGRYDVIGLNAFLTADKADLDVHCIISFEAVEEDTEKLAQMFVFCSLPDGSKNVASYYYAYDPDERTLMLEPSCATKNIIVDLPQKLYCLNREKPNFKDEILWARWLDNYCNNYEDEMLNFMVESEGEQFVDDLDITDVSISRQHLTITIQGEAERDTRYRVNLADYPSLVNVTPNRDICLLRHLDDNAIYVEWFEPHYVIPLNQFEKLDS